MKNYMAPAKRLKPGALNPVFDVTRIAGKYFLVNGSAEYNLSLDELIRRLGFSREGKAVSGAEVPGMIERGEFEDVIYYSAMDSIDAGRAYLAMAGKPF